MCNTALLCGIGSYDTVNYISSTAPFSYVCTLQSAEASSHNNVDTFHWYTVTASPVASCMQLLAANKNSSLAGQTVWPVRLKK